MKRFSIFLLVFAVALLSLMPAAAQDEAPSGDLEIFSWWVGGGEAAGLEALIEDFAAKYPDVNVINAAVAGGAGVNATAVLTSRMLGGDPPDTFQWHAGEELSSIWVRAGLLEPLNDMYEENGWFEAFPQGLLDLISDDEGNVYVVPVNIHRSNVMWYVPGNLEEWGVTVPASWDEFVNETCPTLQEQGVTPISVGETWTQVHLWESVALGVLGPEGYAGLWDGSTDWTSDTVTSVFETFGQVLDCANEDMSALSWQDASQMVAEGSAAFNIMGDWAAGLFLVDLGLVADEGFAWAPSPGTEGTFMMLSDTFGLPVGAPNAGAVRAWLNYLGSVEAQDIFNPLKGSLPANTQADISNEELYNVYFQDAYNDWTSNEIAGSLAHGVVASRAFMNGFNDIIASFAADHDATSAAANAAILGLQTGDF
ncbi:carbohydrate ABC transporter substrate-binding protein [Phototrophicus methaneseepsis]|uniref:Probable sugar-binding periplasmic protein n=1 Tax=Phototrophicus methaneseepsis TaxID=2710758 RepID=A0A7S8ECU4_9CHLR|nr:ABC transporter substrate-binding protein [Phototrophicus methaneseepsis]QPC84610.1 carbohydrate ABC transporter substrate-binding protein [Phototrophicus methaneseepsis]